MIDESVVTDRTIYVATASYAFQALLLLRIHHKALEDCGPMLLPPEVLSTNISDSGDFQIAP